MDDSEYYQNKYAKNKLPDRTYVSKSVFVKRNGEMKEIRYISKVFDIEDFQEFYKDLKNKKICKVLRDGQRQEVLVIVDKDTRGFSLRIQRFTKETGVPHGQSFSFHSGALVKLIEFIDSLGFIDFSNKSYFKINDDDIKKQKQFWLDNKDLIKSINRFDSSLLKQIFSKIEDEKKLGIIMGSLSSVELDNLEATIKQTAHKESIEDLNSLLNLEKDGNIVESIKKQETLTKYVAGQPEKIFQNWIEENLWIFGVEYYKKHNWRIIDNTPDNSSEADLVMETVDGFIDLIELKRPKLKSSLFIFDSEHKSYYPSSELSKPIGQCLLYLKKLDEQKNKIENDRNTKVLKPRIKLIIGRNNDFGDDEKKALKMLNSNLHQIEIITYDDLLKNGEIIISHYGKRT